MPAPQILLDLVNSLQLVGVPSSAAAGDRISPRITPDLTAPAAGINPLLDALVRSDPLAMVNVDLRPIVNYIAQTLGIDVATVLKAVEFDRPAETRADQVDLASARVRDLPHLVPLGPSNVLNLSQLVEGLIGRSSGKLTFTGQDLPSQVTALITKPAVLASLPTVALNFRLLDEAGVPLVPGTHFLGSITPPAPDFVLLPVVFEPGTNAPAVVRRSIACDVTVTYTPIGGAQETIQHTLGPLPIDLSTTLVPLMVVLTEHAVGDSSFPGRVLVGVPANSPLPDAAAAFGALGQMRGVLRALNAGLDLLSIPIPDSIAAARSALATVAGLSIGRFRKGDLIGFFEWVVGIPPWDDWQQIFSAMFVFGPSSRHAFVGAPKPLSGFELFPSALGVGAVPDFAAQPPAASVGTAIQRFPPLPEAPPGGSFNDLITSVNFAFP